MPSSSISSRERLEELLHRFVDVLRFEGGYTWDLFVRITHGRSAVIEFDGFRLHLAGRGADAYELVTSPGDPDAPLNFRTDPSTVRDLISGHETLDGAISSGRVFVRGSLDDLLAMYQLVMNVLADAPRSASLRSLFHEFDATWPADEPAARPLEVQSPRHGFLISQIPEAVLRIEVER